MSLCEVADAYKRDRPLKKSSKSEIERHVTTTFEAWLKKPIANITRELVTKRFNEIKNHGLRGDGPAPAQANQGFSVLRALFNYAIREYRRPDGSASGLPNSKPNTVRSALQTLAATKAEHNTPSNFIFPSGL